MAHRIVIRNLGPIEKCDLTCTPFMTFTGTQASGKSTIAKAIFYFRTIQDDIYNLLLEERNTAEAENDSTQPYNKLLSILAEKFSRTFGSLERISQGMTLSYFYSDEYFIELSIKRKSRGNMTTSDLVVSPSKPLENIIVSILTDRNLKIASKEYILHLNGQREHLERIFSDSRRTIYIPAGRSIITLFSQQLLYFYSIMDDAKKRTLDYCTQNYIERILSIKPDFTNGINDILRHRRNKSFTDEKAELAHTLCHRILKGDYIFSGGNEQLMLRANKSININYASSGQQESVWILNLLLYYLSDKGSNTFIIEEPESNLFPESQKYITEFIALAYNCGASVLLTTHSPYVLGTLNNLIYAGQSNDKTKENVSAVIDQNLWIAKEDFTPYYVDQGTAEICIEEETGLIRNELIDEISDVINTEYDKIFEINEKKAENS